MITVLFAILLAENICLAAYLYFRPDRAIRQAETEKHTFLTSAALKILNRGFGIQGAPAMDNEFDDETPARPELSEDEIVALGPDAALEELQAMEDKIADAERPAESRGSIARRREMVGRIARLRARIEEGIPSRLPVSPMGEVFVAPPLDSQDEAHLESLRRSN